MLIIKLILVNTDYRILKLSQFRPTPQTNIHKNSHIQPSNFASCIYYTYSTIVCLSIRYIKLRVFIQ